MKQSSQSHSNESNARVPVASGSGESGRERVGDGVPTAKLLLLLLRALPGYKKTNKNKSERFTQEKHNQSPRVFHEHDKQSGEGKLPTIGLGLDAHRNSSCICCHDGVYT